MTYSDKLKHPKWQKKRLEILQRDEFKCTLCGDTETTLAIHHEKYNGEPWEVPNCYLKTLCEHCHTIVSLEKGNEIFSIKSKLSQKGNHMIYYAYDKEKVSVYSGVNSNKIEFQFAISYDSLDFIKNNIPE